MKKLLLHSCCAPCSTAVIERLLESMPEYNILVFYYNPNIYPQEEYEKRKNEQIRYINMLNNAKIGFINADYEDALFEEKVKDLHNENYKTFLKEVKEDVNERKHQMFIDWKK